MGQPLDRVQPDVDTAKESISSELPPFMMNVYADGQP